MTADQLYNEVIKKLIGSIEPVGESHTDAERLENLQKHIIVTERLIKDLLAVTDFEFSKQHSCSTAGKEAVYAIRCITGNLSDNLK